MSIAAATRPDRPRHRMRLSWSDRRFRGLVGQVLVVSAVAALAFWLWRNTVTNLDARHIATGFGFLKREAGMPIADALISYRPSDTYLRALVIGVLNTLRVAIVGIVLATLLGTFIGIARLSKNWLLAKVAAVYVEMLRDIPLLLQLLFWYIVLQGLPAPRQALQPLPGVFLSNRGLLLPAIDWDLRHGWVLLAAIIGIVGALCFRTLARARQMADGEPRSVWPVALVLIVGLPLAVSTALSVPWTVRWPELRGFNFAGGTAFSPEYVALLVALTTYTAALIAEIVRAGILSVSRV